MKTRFCPSPTGFVHLGNVRTALFNYLFAHKHQTTFLLRIEDTDQLRSDPKFTKQLIEDLHWMGLDWQEGPEIGGSAGPYWQSERQAIYDQYYEKLVHAQLAYPCFCSEQHLSIMRKLQLSSGKAPRYDGTCRQLTPEQVKHKLEQGEKAALRFRIPADEIIEFPDIVKGLQRFHSNDLGDFIIRRTDGTPPFIFCSGIDDALMGVTHVLRGEDHLTNTPRQLLILKHLNLHAPTYGHISLITEHDGSALSKRLGSLGINTMRIEGYFSLAIINYLARLGHHYQSNDYMTLTELAQQFELTSLSGAPARFDEHHLLHWQKLAVMHVDDESLWQWFGIEIEHLVPAHLKYEFLKAVRPNCLFPQDGRHWAQRFFAPELIYTEEDIRILRHANHAFFHEAITAVEQHAEEQHQLAAKAIYQHLTQTLGLQGRALYQPLRIALTGVNDGPELATIFNLLGADRVKARFHLATRMI